MAYPPRGQGGSVHESRTYSGIRVAATERGPVDYFGGMLGAKGKNGGSSSLAVALAVAIE